MVAAALAWLVLLQPVSATPTSWVLAYDGKSTNDFYWDKRARILVTSRVPAKLSADVLARLGGPPEPVIVTGHRYAAMSACMAHSCQDKGFFWIDTVTGAGLGASFSPAIAGTDERALLRLGSNAFFATQLPTAARTAVSAWLSEEDLSPDEVQFVARDGTVGRLQASAFAPASTFRPPPGGPSFDCGRASTTIEKAICGDAALMGLDLDMFKLYREMRHGYATAAARQELQQLQRDWIRARDAACAAAADVSKCVADAYRGQTNRLRNWTPTPK